MAFTKCPKCETKTRQRKLPLVIHIEPGYMFVLNKTCRYCERCDLLIARQEHVEAIMAETFATRAPDIVGNEYQVIGTMDRADWRDGVESKIQPTDVADRMYLFEDVWTSRSIPAAGIRPARDLRNTAKIAQAYHRDPTPAAAGMGHPREPRACSHRDAKARRDAGRGRDLSLRSLRPCESIGEPADGTLPRERPAGPLLFAVFALFRGNHIPDALRLFVGIAEGDTR